MIFSHRFYCTLFLGLFTGHVWSQTTGQISPTHAELLGLTESVKDLAASSPDSALVLSRQILASAREAGEDSLTGQIFIALSTSFGFSADYDSAAHYALLAIEVARKYNDTLTIIDGSNNLAIDLMYQEEYTRSLGYFEETETLARQIKDTLRWAHALTNVGIIHGYMHASESELQYYEQAADLFRQIDEQEGLANTLLNKGTVYTVMKRFTEAEELYEQALDLFQELEIASGIQNTVLSLAENAYARADFTQARHLALQALELAQSNQFSQDELYTYELLTKIAEQELDFQQAYTWKSTSSDLRELLFNEEKSRQINELEKRYEVERKQAEIQRLHLINELQLTNISRLRNAQLAIAASAIMIITVLVVFLIYRSKRQKAEMEASELRLEALKKRFMELHSSPSELSVKLEMDELNRKLNTPLTEREFDVLRLSIEGKTNAEISEQLFISVSTVKFHLRNTYSKIGVGNRKEAFHYMLKTS